MDVPVSIPGQLDVGAYYGGAILAVPYSVLVPLLAAARVFNCRTFVAMQLAVLSKVKSCTAPIHHNIVLQCVKCLLQVFHMPDLCSTLVGWAQP